LVPDILERQSRL